MPTRLLALNISKCRGRELHRYVVKTIKWLCKYHHVPGGTLPALSHCAKRIRATHWTWHTNATQICTTNDPGQWKTPNYSFVSSLRRSSKGKRRSVPLQDRRFFSAEFYFSLFPGRTHVCSVGQLSRTGLFWQRLFSCFLWTPMGKNACPALCRNTNKSIFEMYVQMNSTSLLLLSRSNTTCSL